MFRERSQRRRIGRGRSRSHGGCGLRIAATAQRWHRRIYKINVIRRTRFYAAGTAANRWRASLRMVFTSIHLRNKNQICIYERLFPSLLCLPPTSS